MKNSKALSIRILCLFLWILAASAGSHAVAQGYNALVEKANKAYSDGLYAEASELYKKVAAAGYESPELYFNLGNTCFKLNDFPGAILWYERAKRLDPGNEDISFNLNVANSKIADKIEPVPEMFYRRWYFLLVNRFPADGWAWISVIFFLTAIASATLYLVSRHLFLRKTGFWAAGALLFLFLATFGFALSAADQSRNMREAVIFTPSVTVKSSPDDKSVDLFVLHEGTKVRIIDQIGKWYEIRIANGSVGWLPEGMMEQI